MNIDVPIKTTNLEGKKKKRRAGGYIVTILYDKEKTKS